MSLGCMMPITMIGERIKLRWTMDSLKVFLGVVMSKKELCREIYRSVILNDACHEWEIFKKFMDSGDYGEALLFANGERWLRPLRRQNKLQRLGISDNICNKIIEFCGGDYRCKRWYSSGQINLDSKSKYVYRLWHCNGQMATDHISENEYRKWRRNGTPTEDRK